MGVGLSSDPALLTKYSGAHDSTMEGGRRRYHEGWQRASGRYRSDASAWASALSTPHPHKHDPLTHTGKVQPGQGNIPCLLTERWGASKEKISPRPGVLQSWKQGTVQCHPGVTEARGLSPEAVTASTEKFVHMSQYAPSRENTRKDQQTGQESEQRRQDWGRRTERWGACAPHQDTLVYARGE